MNLYGFVKNNPINKIDPLGLKVTIAITNTTFTDTSITGAITATSDHFYALPFSGYQIQASKAGSCECKSPLADGTYSAFVRTDRVNKIELSGTDRQNLENIQIHVANAPTVNGEEKLDGCVGVGTSKGQSDWVNDSINGMQAIMNVISADGSGDIEVMVTTPNPTIPYRGR